MAPENWERAPGPAGTPSTLVLEGKMRVINATRLAVTEATWVYKNLYPHVPGSIPPAQMGWSKLDFPNILDCCLENCSVSSLALPLHIWPPFFWDEA